MNINDVAHAAGVSRGSVSNYLNDKKVSDKIKIKIEKAIADLNYVPNTAARDLRAQDSKFVIFIVPTVWTAFFSELTYHVQNELSTHGLKMILSISNSDFTKEKEYVAIAEAQKAAGIISVSYSDLNYHVKASMPMVSIEKEPTGNIPLISSDNYQGGQLAAERLVASGAKQLHYFGPIKLPSNAMAARRSGFEDYCQQHHIEVEFTDLENYQDIEQRRLEIEAKIKSITNFDDRGFFGITDEYAWMVYRALKKRAVQIPKQAQVIGFDGSRSSRNEVPFLSSIRQPLAEIAAAAVDELLVTIDNKNQNTGIHSITRKYLPVTFQQGETTR